MRIRNSDAVKPLRQRLKLDEMLESISEQYLREVIETVAVPRHYTAEKTSNALIATWIRQQFERLGYEANFLGQFDNVIAFRKISRDTPVMIVGAHYDTVPCSPGADDNGSGIAVLLACAQALISLT